MSNWIEEDLDTAIENICGSPTEQRSLNVSEKWLKSTSIELFLRNLGETHPRSRCYPFPVVMASSSTEKARKDNQKRVAELYLLDQKLLNRKNIRSFKQERQINENIQTLIVIFNLDGQHWVTTLTDIYPVAGKYHLTMLDTWQSNANQSAFLIMEELRKVIRSVLGLTDPPRSTSDTHYIRLPEQENSYCCGDHTMSIARKLVHISQTREIKAASFTRPDSHLLIGHYNVVQIRAELVLLLREKKSQLPNNRSSDSRIDHTILDEKLVKEDQENRDIRQQVGLPFLRAMRPAPSQDLLIHHQSEYIKYLIENIKAITETVAKQLVDPDRVLREYEQEKRKFNQELIKTRAYQSKQKARNRRKNIARRERKKRAYLEADHFTTTGSLSGNINSNQENHHIAHLH